MTDPLEPDHDAAATSSEATASIPSAHQTPRWVKVSAVVVGLLLLLVVVVKITGVGAGDGGHGPGMHRRITSSPGQPMAPAPAADRP